MNLKMAGATAAAALLVLTACSSDDDDTATDTTTTDDEAMVEEETDSAEAGTLVDVATEAGDFTTLLAAAEAADLVGVLEGDGPYTVFAPTDESFEALPEGLVDTLLEPENSETLTAILTYHVIPGEVTSDMLTDGDVDTVQGEAVTISTDGPTVNDIAITSADIEASNGVIHVIDGVLVPPSIDVTTLLEQ